MVNFRVTNTKDSGANSLRQAILDANANPGADQITFDTRLRNQTLTLTSGELVITDDLTIEGLGKHKLTIDAGGNSRIFRLVSTSAKPRNLTIRNLTLANGHATATDKQSTTLRGGAILSDHQGTLTVEKVNFRANVADNGGGAIYSRGGGSLTVNRSRFLENQATAGNDERGGGAIGFQGPGQLTVKDSQFIRNAGINGGAINNLIGSVTIENSRFIDNNVLAARFAKGEIRDFLRGRAGAIFSDRASSIDNPNGGTIKIVDSIFRDNQGRSSGGAVHIFTGKRDRVEVLDSVFRNNQVIGLPGGDKGNAGAIALESDEVNRGFLIVNSEFSGNRAVDRGGAVRTRNAPTTIVNSTFSDNRTTISPTRQFTGGLGGALELRGEVGVKISNSTFDHNFATWVGGAIASEAITDVTVNNSIFYQNSAANGTNNWGINQQTSRQLSGSNNIQFPGNGGLVTPSIIVADPLLGSLKNNGGKTLTRELLAGSPAIDSGNNRLIARDIFDLDRDGNLTEPIPFDQRGQGSTRIFNNRVDIGAFEGQSHGNPLTASRFEETLPQPQVGATIDPLMGSTNGDNHLIVGEIEDSLIHRTADLNISSFASTPQFFASLGDDHPSDFPILSEENGLLTPLPIEGTSFLFANLPTQDVNLSSIDSQNSSNFIG